MNKPLDRTPIKKPFSWKTRNPNTNAKQAYRKADDEPKLMRNKITKTLINKPFTNIAQTRKPPYIPTFSSIPKSNLYKGPTLITNEMRDELINQHTHTLEQTLMNDPFIAKNWETLESASSMGTQDNISSVSNLRYKIEIFQGTEYPYPEYADFLHEKSCNLVSFGEIERRTCVGVTKHLIETGTEPLYTDIVSYCDDQDIGNPIPRDIPILQRIEIAKFKTETVTRIRPSVSTFKEIETESDVDKIYLRSRLTKDFRTNLTVVLTTKDINDPDTILISSIIILHNGDSENSAINNGNQYIEVIANNPNIDMYPYLKSSAVSVLFTLVRETTILSSYMPNRNTFGRLPMESRSVESGGHSPMYQFIYNYLTYCATNGSKPLGSAINTVSNFRTLSLSAISWEVAYIYSKLGFVPTNIDPDGYIDMELDISSVSHLLNVNRIGFLFSLLQEMSLERLTDGDTERLIAEIGTLIGQNREVYERSISVLGVPGKKTASMSSISFGGKKHKRNRKTKSKKMKNNKTKKRKYN